MSNNYTYGSGDKVFIRNGEEFWHLRDIITEEYDAVYCGDRPNSYPCLLEVFIFYDEANSGSAFRPSFFYPEEAQRLVSGMFYGAVVTIEPMEET